MFSVLFFNIFVLSKTFRSRPFFLFYINYLITQLKHAIDNDPINQVLVRHTPIIKMVVRGDISECLDMMDLSVSHRREYKVLYDVAKFLVMKAKPCRVRSESADGIINYFRF